METFVGPAGLEKLHLVGSGSALHPPALPEKTTKLRNLAQSIAAGIDAVRAAAVVALGDLEALHRATCSAAGSGHEPSIAARYAELCSDVTHAESVKVSKLEEELVRVDAALVKAEEEPGCARSEYIADEPVEPTVLRVVPVAVGAEGPFSIAVVCAPRAIVASDLAVGGAPLYSFTKAVSDRESGTLHDTLRLDLALRESYVQRCNEEVDFALTLIARKVTVVAFDNTDPVQALLSSHASIDATRRVVSVSISLPPSFDLSPDRAIVIEGVFLRGEPVTQIACTDPSTCDKFPIRVPVLPRDPCDILGKNFLRVGRWSIGMSTNFLVFWNDREECAEGWELVEWTFGSDGWYRYEVGKQRHIFWPRSGSEKSDQAIFRPWKSEKKPFINISFEALVHILKDSRVCKGNTRLLRYDVSAATLTMCNLGGFARTFSLCDGTATADLVTGIFKECARDEKDSWGDLPSGFSPSTFNLSDYRYHPLLYPGRRPMDTVLGPAGLEKLHLVGSGSALHPPALPEKTTKLRNLAQSIAAGIDAVRAAAVVALDDLEALHRAACSVASSGLDSSIAARYAELCSDVTQTESVKVAKLEEELVRVDAALAKAEDEPEGAWDERFGVEPAEPTVLRVVPVAVGAEVPFSIAVLCAPRAIAASDLAVGGAPLYSITSKTAGDEEGEAVRDALRLDLTLRESYGYRCEEEVDVVLSIIARQVKVVACDNADPAKTQLSMFTSIDVARRVVSAFIALPPSFDPSPDRAIVVEGVFLRGEPVTQIVRVDPSSCESFPIRVPALSRDPFEILQQNFLRVGRWNIGLHSSYLVFWNDRKEHADGWELVEWTFGSNGWYRFEVGKQKYIYWPGSGQSSSDQAIHRPWKFAKKPFVEISFEALVHILEDSRVCKENTRLLRFDVSAATLTMCNLGGHARTFSLRDGTATADLVTGIVTEHPRSAESW